MAKTITQAPKPQTLRYPTPPLKLYEQIFCANCDAHCNPNETRFLICVLTLIADDLARTRQLLQHRTQHLSW
jgi:hypothetical protein